MSARRIPVFPLLFVLFTGTMLCLPMAARGQIKTTKAGNWFDPAIWDAARVPGEGDSAQIIHVVVLDGDAGSINQLQVQTVINTTPHLIVTNNATLTSTNATSWVGRGNRRGNTLSIYSGELTCAGLRLGWHIADGAGGIINLYGGTLNAGLNIRAHACEFNLHGGVANFSSLAIGNDFTSVANPVNPVFRQYGGTNNTPRILVADGNAFPGEYHLYGGVVRFTSVDGIQLVHNNRTTSPVAILILGDESGSGKLEETVSGANFWIGGLSATAYTRVEGWCDQILMTGALRNCGQVIANGWGADVDRDLDLRSFASVVRTGNNSSSNGWFAVNRARLRLPPIPFETDAGAVAKTWGDNVGEASLVLVNSLRVTLDNVTTAGGLAIDLLSPDWSDVAVAPEGAQLIGVWDVDAGDLAFDTADVTMRYDDVRAAATGVDGWSDKLALFRDAGSGWTRLTAGLTVDTVNHRVDVAGLDGFSRLAVGVYESPAGTVLLVR